MLIASSEDPLVYQRSKMYNICEFCCDGFQSQQKEMVSREDCTAMYCNELCRRSASASSYRVLCSKDFSWLYDVDRTDKPNKRKAVDKGKAVEGALWLRVIALCIQEGCHPLDQL